MSNSKLRAHHGLCLHFFIGEGYSGEFISNMAMKKSELEQNPYVELISSADIICMSCPHKVGEMDCATQEKVTDLDRKVLEFCGLRKNEVLKYMDFSEIVKEKIIKTGKFNNLCKGCSWYYICSEIVKEKFVT